MPLAVEMMLVQNAARAVETLWSGIAAAGLTAPPAAGPARPHITLAVGETGDVAALKQCLADFAAETAALPVRFTGLSTFSGPPAVVYRAPAADDALSAAHARLHALVRPHLRAPWGYYLPGVWVPHCTLAQDLDPDALPAALEVCRRLPGPGAGYLVEVALTSFRPVRQLSAHPLRAAPTS